MRLHITIFLDDIYASNIDIKKPMTGKGSHATKNQYWRNHDKCFLDLFYILGRSRCKNRNASKSIFGNIQVKCDYR